MNRKVLLTILLVLAVVYALFSYLPVVAPYFNKPSAGVKTEVAGGAAPAEVASETVSIEAFQIQDEELKNLVNPFALRIAVQEKREEAIVQPPPAPISSPIPMVSTATKEPSQVPVRPQLQGVLVSGEMRFAVISGVTVREGATILGWHVREIGENYVFLEKSNGKTLKLEVE